MSNFFNRLLAGIMPILGMLLFIVIFIVAIVFFSYVFIVIAIIGFILFGFVYIKAKFFSPKPPQQDEPENSGRTIDHDDKQ